MDPRTAATVRAADGSSNARLGLSCLMILLLGLLAACSQGAKPMLTSAEALFARGDYLGAVREFERVTEQYPRSPEAGDALFWIGKIELLHVQDYQKAIEAFRNLVSGHPSHHQASEAQRLIAQIYDQKLNDSRLAIAEYQKLIQGFPDDSDLDEAQFRIGDAYFSLHSMEQARIEWEALTKRWPESTWSVEALYRIGNTYYVEERFEEALKIFRRVQSSYPESKVAVDARIGEAGCLEGLDRLEDALRAYTELLDLNQSTDLIEIRLKSLKDRMARSGQAAVRKRGIKPIDGQDSSQAVPEPPAKAGE